MIKFETIKFSTLHLDGEAHEWLYHGLVTLGNSNITSHLDLNQKSIELFDKKDPEFHFRELTQLKQEGSPNNYITKFKKLEVMMSNIYEQRLVMYFIEGLFEPLRGWVKDFKTKTLQDVIPRTRNMQGVVPKIKKNSKPFIQQKTKDKKPPQKEGTCKEKLYEATKNELRINNLFFHCKVPWLPR
jgi:hypothetical protein